MLLQNNPKFQQEYKEFTDKINSLSNNKIKLEAQRLLRDLLSEVKRLDHNHSELNFQNQLPDSVSLTRNKLFEIRKNLKKLLP